ncbi:MAG TPA: nitroreductase family deazaflavin-dependent oxidoreductase [Methylomirabilota bacterium]|nr:nitroreductase family deazaflavin-dependent oxidoreductase [Methylomirabilota bacterium]
MSPEAKYLYLTTIGRRTGLPRQIEIWFTRHAGRYYLVAEHRLKVHWVRNLLADPAVRVRVGRRSFEGRARVVDPRSERELVAAIRERSEDKYGWGAGLVVEIAPAARRGRTTKR